jgi:hypothetical protein
MAPARAGAVLLWSRPWAADAPSDRDQEGQLKAPHRISPWRRFLFYTPWSICGQCAAHPMESAIRARFEITEPPGCCRPSSASASSLTGLVP